MLTKKEADELVKMNGEARGQVFTVDWDFINEKYGEKGIKKLEGKMRELGHPLIYKKIKTLGFYPLGLYVISLLSIKEIFNFNEKDIEEMGRSVVKFSLIMKIFLKYFTSLDLIARQVPATWRRHYTSGDFEMPEYSRERRYAVLRLRNFADHPVHCNLFSGYFAKLAQMVVGSPTTCQETKCVFKGDDYHELYITW